MSTAGGPGGGQPNPLFLFILFLSLLAGLGLFLESVVHRGNALSSGEIEVCSLSIFEQPEQNIVTS